MDTELSGVSGEVQSFSVDHWIEKMKKSSDILEKLHDVSRMARKRDRLGTLVSDSKRKRKVLEDILASLQAELENAEWRF